jgi:DNA-binding IclR family transcriptional regulator
MSRTGSDDGSGSSVVVKAGSLLRALGSAGREGLTTATAARRAGVSRPTAHRLLAALADEGFADRDRVTGRWQIGPELYLLGLAAAPRYDVTEHARDILTQLADDTGESTYLSALRGTETVCLAEVQGSFPLRSHVLHEGIRLPLGVASAGLAILAHLPDAEAEGYLSSVDLTKEWGRSHSRRALRARVAETRKHGYAVNPGLLVEGSWGLGAAVFDATGNPRWALSLTGVQTRFVERRLPKLGRLLLDSAHALGRRVDRV